MKKGTQCAYHGGGVSDDVRKRFASQSRAREPGMSLRIPLLEFDHPFDLPFFGI
jgi:hypothetical protein